MQTGAGCQDCPDRSLGGGRAPLRRAPVMNCDRAFFGFQLNSAQAAELLCQRTSNLGHSRDLFWFQQAPQTVPGTIVRITVRPDIVNAPQSHPRSEIGERPAARDPNEKPPSAQKRKQPPDAWREANFLGRASDGDERAVKIRKQEQAGGPPDAPLDFLPGFQQVLRAPHASLDNFFKMDVAHL